MEFIYNAGNPKNIRLTKEQKFELTFCVIWYNAFFVLKLTLSVV